MFGGGFGGGQEEEEQIPKGADVYVELEASLEELYLGATITVSHRSTDVKLCWSLSSATASSNGSGKACRVTTWLVESRLGACFA